MKKKLRTIILERKNNRWMSGETRNYRIRNKDSSENLG